MPARSSPVLKFATITLEKATYDFLKQRNPTQELSLRLPATGAWAMSQAMVQELMRHEPQSIVGPDISVRDAAGRLLQSECDLLVVTRPDGRLLGIVCESSLVRLLLSSPREQQSIEPLIVSHVDSVRSTASLASVMHLFRSACNTTLPVLDDHEVVCGLLYRRDVVGAMLGHQFPDRPATGVTQCPPAPAPQAGAAETSGEGQSGPYFLKGRDARRRLRLVDPGHDGFPNPLS